MKEQHAERHCSDGVVLDFESTGLSPGMGARVIEVGAVLFRNGTIVEEFQSLMNPAVSLPKDVSRLTGITSEALKKAPANERVIRDLLKFLGRNPLIAHRATNERQFLERECRLYGFLPPNSPYFCTLRLARELLPQAPDYKLSTLANYLKLPNEGTLHRALPDARTTAHLWACLWSQHREKTEKDLRDIANYRVGGLPWKQFIPTGS